MKKITAIILTVLMVMGMVGTVCAEYEAGGVAEALNVVLEKEGITLPIVTGVSVDADVRAKASGADNYATEDVVNVTYKSKGRTFDFCANVDLSNVKEVFVDKMLSVKGAFAVAAGDTETYDAYMEKFYALPVTGSFDIVAKYNNKLEAPAMSHDMLSADETLFTWGEPVDDNGEIKLTVNVAEGVTVRDIEKKLFASKLTFTCEGMKAVDAGEYEVKGSFTGSTTIKEADDVIAEYTFKAVEDSVTAKVTKSSGNVSSSDTGSTGTNTGSTGTNTGSTGTDTGSTGTDTGSTGTDTGSTGTDTGSTGTDTGSTGTDTGSTGTDTGSTGTDTGSTGTDTGSTGTDTGSTGTTETAPKVEVEADVKGETGTVSNVETKDVEEGDKVSVDATGKAADTVVTEVEVNAEVAKDLGEKKADLEIKLTEATVVIEAETLADATSESKKSEKLEVKVKVKDDVIDVKISVSGKDVEKAKAKITIPYEAKEDVLTDTIEVVNANGEKVDAKFAEKDSKVEFAAEGNGEYKVVAATVKEAIILGIDEHDAHVYGENKKNDVAPKIKNDRTMLPARFVAENLGAEVTWDETARKVTVVRGEVKIEITIDANVAVVNGAEVELDSPAYIENDRTYTPVRFIAEQLNAKVYWNENSQKVTIVK